MEGARKNRISNAGAVGLILFAIIADLFSLIPGVGDFSGPAFWAIASFYLSKHGCGLLNKSRFATGAISTIAEIIPIIQSLPATTAGIIVIIYTTRKEDKANAKNKQPDINANARNPLYSTDQNGNGVRFPQVTQPRDVIPQPNNKNGVRAPNGGLTR